MDYQSKITSEYWPSSKAYAQFVENLLPKRGGISQSITSMLANLKDNVADFCAFAVIILSSVVIGGILGHMIF